MPTLDSFGHTDSLVSIFILLLLASGALLMWQKRRAEGLIVFLLLLLSATLIEGLELFSALSASEFVLPLLLALGPSFYLMCYHLVYADKPSLVFRLSHYLPAVVAFIFSPDPHGVMALALFSQLGYAVLGIRLIRKYHVAAFACIADAETSKLDWVYWGLVGMLLIDVLEISVFFEQVNLSDTTQFAGTALDLLVVSLSMLYLLVKAIKNPDLFDGLEQYESWADQPSVEVDNDYRSQAKQLFKQLEHKLVDEKYYRQQSLSVDDLVGETGSNQRDICWAIVQEAGCNFCDFVNVQRVEAMKRELARGLTGADKLIELALATGFKSAHSFNAVFKRFTGVVPDQYHSHLQENH